MWVNTWYIQMTDVTIECDSMVKMIIYYDIMVRDDKY